MPPLHLRQEFPTLKAFKEALHAWAIEAHFEPRILKSDTGRVRVGCKRDPACPFVIRCNWERKNGREPLARVTVLKDRHTCLDGVEWVTTGTAGGMGGAMGGGAAGGGGAGGAVVGVGHVPGGVMQNGNVGVPGNVGGNGVHGMGNTLEIRQDADGNIMGGARVLGPVERRGVDNDAMHEQVVPVLPKVQRNSASRLPFLMEILPRHMNITKDTTPVEIRDCLLREYNAEVHLQQCRRAKTEILKKQETGGGAMDRGGGGGGGQNSGGSMSHQNPQQQDMRTHQPHHSLDGLGSDSANDGSGQLFGDMTAQSSQSPHPFTLHAAPGGVTPIMQDRSAAALRTVAEAPVRCPYCINHRWMRSIKDAVEHMSMHVVV